MSHHSGNYGGGYRGQPATTRDKTVGWFVLALMACVALGVIFGPFIAAVVWWVR